MKLRALFLMALLAASSAGADAETSAATPVSKVSAAVRITALRRQTVSDMVQAYGMVTVDPRQLRAISLARGGQIADIYVSVGQRVGKGMPLLSFVTSPEAAAAYRQAVAALQAAEAQRHGIAQLLQQQLATQAQLAAADKVLADAQAALTAQHKNGAGIAAERLTAPFDAVVSAILVSPGDRIMPGAPLMQLAKSGAMRVVLGVEPADVVRIHSGMPVQISAVFGTATAESRITQVAGVIDPQTQLVDTLVALPVTALMPGSHVRGAIQLAQYTATVVPRSAVLRDDRGAYLFQVRNGKAQRVGIKIGLEQNGITAVSGALLTNAPVVVSGNYELQDGMAVRIIP
ncbi:MAG: efflux RND transporter periplasmic adaptor subunit [Thiobacillus sp.]